MPVGAATFAEALRMGVGDLPHAAAARSRRPGTTPMSATRAASRRTCRRPSAALDFVMQAIEKAGYAAGKDVVLALDCASTEFFKDGAYHYEGEGKTRSPQEQVEYLAEPRRRTIRSCRSRTAWPRTTGRAGSS